MIRTRSVFLGAALLALLISSVAWAVTIGIVQRWHGTIEADNVLAQHFIGGGQAAVGTPVAGTGCNTSSAPTATGSDVSGQVGITCGGSGAASGTVLTLSFTHAYQHNPLCSITPANNATASIPVAQMVYTSNATAALDIQGNNTTGLASGTYLWNYTCTDRLP